MKRLYWWFKFYFATKQRPVQDDLERCMCTEGGKIGHFHCGWSRKWNHPMFMLTHSQILDERK